MHYEKTVVTLVDNNKKPLREFDSQKLPTGRKCTVFLPFETEYIFLVKNNSDRRIKMDIDIDGTNVMGSGLIIPAYLTTHIERFSDVSKKFKFVSINNEGVSDPSNPENGIVTVRVSEEIRLPPPVIIPMHTPQWPTHYNSSWYGHGPGSGPCRRGIAPLRGINSECSTKSIGAVSSDVGSAGATIEGSVSNQVFSQTTWAGSESTVTTFKFYLRAPSQKDQDEYQKYLELKAKFE